MLAYIGSVLAKKSLPVTAQMVAPAVVMASNCAACVAMGSKQSCATCPVMNGSAIKELFKKR